MIESTGLSRSIDPRIFSDIDDVDTSATLHLIPLGRDDLAPKVASSGLVGMAVASIRAKTVAHLVFVPTPTNLAGGRHLGAGAAMGVDQTHFVDDSDRGQKCQRQGE